MFSIRAASRIPSRGSTIPSPAVQDPLAATASTHTPSPRLPHNLHGFHSLSQCSCGSLGKLRSHLPRRAPVFLMSCSSQLRFRKPAPVSNPRPDAISPLFPLFLPHLRVLLAFIYLSLHLSSPSRRDATRIMRHRSTSLRANFKVAPFRGAIYATSSRRHIPGPGNSEI